MESYVDHLRFLRKSALQLRIDVLKVMNHVQSGHLGGSMSIIEMLTAIYCGQLPSGPVLQYNPEKPGSEDQDYFVLSKGHASLAWYTVLADTGFFPKEELLHYRQMHSMLQAYPWMKVPGVSLSSGSPGYGLAAATGLAMALKMGRHQNRVICMVGDGELQDGQFWEAVLVAAHQKLENITLLIDWNGLQMDGAVRSVVGIEPVADKFQAFGWRTIPVSDGHNFEDLLLGFEKAFEVQRRPSVMICRTVKGKGVAFAENKPFYHAEVLSTEEMEEALPRLEEEYELLDQS